MIKAIEISERMVSGIITGPPVNRMSISRMLSCEVASPVVSMAVTACRKNPIICCSLVVALCRMLLTLQRKEILYTMYKICLNRCTTEFYTEILGGMAQFVQG